MVLERTASLRREGLSRGSAVYHKRRSGRGE